ncbi:hypothetical protein B0H16DRAFT_1710919 [Mycena metata]|uniref:Uncharacterized protein n=1 Tax=Mycena metata TaxID=1033252 RepID=A0AAD7K755_9AGAR|nr:hypothetical protein B0H16DRAFT_1710919 [Mycena metata]
MAALDDVQPEDLAQPDTFDEHLAAITSTPDLDTGGKSHRLVMNCDSVDDVPPVPSSISYTSASTSKPSTPRKARDKVGSKARRQTTRQALEVQAHIDLLPPTRRPKHVKNAVPVKTKFRLMKQHIVMWTAVL